MAKGKVVNQNLTGLAITKEGIEKAICYSKNCKAADLDKNTSEILKLQDENAFIAFHNISNVMTVSYFENVPKSNTSKNIFKK